MPCNFHLRALAAKVKEGIRAAGGTPMEFNTIAISDGITMGTPGMRASLVSREVIADSIELVVARATCSTRVIALSGCDKTIPGTVMALARLNVPGVMLYGGSIMPGHFHGQRRHDPGRLRGGRRPRRRARSPTPSWPSSRTVASPGRRRLRRPVHRQHDGDGLRGDGHLARSARRLVPAVRTTRKREVAERGRRSWSWTCSRAACGPATSSPATRFENAIAAIAASGGSTNGVLHLLGARPRDGRRAVRSTTSTQICERTPLLCDLKPGGRYVAPDLLQAGGVPLVLQAPAGGRPAARGRADGHRPDDRRDRRRRRRDRRARTSIRPLDDPIKRHRRPGDPARQPRARGLRGQARRPRAAPAHRPGARVRERGGRDGGRHRTARSSPATSS